MQAVRDLTRRVHAPERMDQLNLAAADHYRALRGLERLNFVSGSARIVWPKIAAIAGAECRKLRVLDLATGGGDVPLGVWRRSQHAGCVSEILGLDVSSRAVQVAQQKTGAGKSAVSFSTRNVLLDPLPEGFDVVMTSLFLHHLDDEQAVGLLARMATAARRLVLVNDLVRSRLTLALVALAARLLTRSRVVWEDAAISVRASFTVAELSAIAEKAGLHGATIHRRFPCRMLLAWSKQC